MVLPAKQEQYTFADVLTWDEGENIEIISGKAFMMATPSRIHQKISMELSRQLANFLERKSCEVYPAPFSVRLFEQDGDSPENVDTAVEPDISVVCDRSKLDKHGCKGAPDWIIEVVSPGNRRMDYYTKLFKYRTASVKEYWIVDDERNLVIVYDFQNNSAANFTFSDDIPVCIYPEFHINLSSLNI